MPNDKDNKHNDDVPTEVADAIFQFVEHVHGRGPALDLDGVSDDVRAAVEDLLPAVAEAVFTGEGAPTADVPDWRASSVASALGLVPVEGKRRISGSALRGARKAAGLTEADLARVISERGRTVTTNFVEDIEARPGFAVEPEIINAIAAAVGVMPEAITLADDVRTDDTQPTADVSSRGKQGKWATAVVDEVTLARADVEVTQAHLGAVVGRKPLVALRVGRLGLDTWVLLFDVIDQARLWDQDIFAAAESVFAVEPDTVLIFCVASDNELSTQPLDLSDLKGAVEAPSGQRLHQPRRPILALRDSIRGMFEEFLPAWDDVDLPSSTARSSSVASRIEQMADARLTTATSTSRVRLESRKAGLAIVSRRKPHLVAAMGRLADEIRSEELDDDEFEERLFAPLAEAS